MASGGLRARLFCVVGLAFPLLACARGAHASIRLTVQPQVLVADGRSTASVTVEVRDRQGRLVSDGTPVHFTTTSGTITAVAYTSSGTARAVLTSGTSPAAVMVTAVTGTDQAIGRVQMVSEMVEANVDARVLRLNARYVAFSEELHYLDSIQDARVRYRGLTIEANAIQIELDGNRLKAFGKVGLTSGEKVLEGERLYLNLTTFEGLLVTAEKKIWFSGFGLNDLPEPPKTESADFNFRELTNSTLSWIGKEAIYIPGVKVQLRGARAYVGGIKALRMPYHEAHLDGGIVGDYGQYIGAGSDGLIIDIPLYVYMTPNASSAVRLRNGERTGFGYFNGRPGFGVDLEEKYGVSGQSDGLMTMNDVSSSDWGFRWHHTQQFGPKTRLTSVFETPAHADFYGQFNFARQMTFGNLTLNLAGNKLRNREFGRTIDAGFETNPKPVLNQRLFVSVGTRYTDIGGGQFQQLQDRRFDILPTQTQEVSLRLRPETVHLLPKMSFSNNVSMRMLWGTISGPALGYQSNLTYNLPRNTNLMVGYTFDQAPVIRSVINQAHHNLSAMATTAPAKGLRASVFGTMGLDVLSQTLTGQLSYNITPKWRIDLLHSFYQFNTFGVTDYQIGIARKLGPREILVYYSTETGRVLFELAASNF
jgi:hypothetical protein